MARALARRQPGADDANRPVTVSEALDRYQRDLESRGADAQNANRVRRHLPPTLATKPVALLTMNDLRHWRDGLVSKGVAPATINRTRAGLRAALELAASLDDRISNRNAFRSGLKGLPGGKNARRVVLPKADVLRIVQAAYEHDRAFGIVIELLAQTGARISQAAQLTCGDLQADGPDPRVLMPASYKGRGEKERRQVPVPITAALAALLAELKGDRPDDAPLLRKSDGSRWLEINKSEHWNLFRLVAERAGFDPDVITSYALRHSSICRALVANVPVSVVAKLHDTSSDKLTNGSKTLPDTDGRLRIARRFRGIANAVLADQGGAELCSESRRQLIRRFSAACVLAEDLEGRLARGEEIDVERHALLCSTLTRLAQRIGIDRRAKNITPSLGDYLRSPPPTEIEEAAE